MCKRLSFNYSVTILILFLLQNSLSAQINWTKHPGNPVLQNGSPGSWDENVAIHPTVLYEDGMYKMWYGGEGGIGAQIGLATSSDGISWDKYANNPVIQVGDSGSWDDRLVTLPNIIRVDNIYHLYYWGGDVEGFTDDAVGHATSSDGFNWVKDPQNPVFTAGADGEWDDWYVAPGGVLYQDSLFYLYYGGFGNETFGGGSIGLATSVDGVNWTRSRANPLLQPDRFNWDFLFIHSPKVYNDGQIYHMWFHGGVPPFQHGYATSIDGETWTKHLSNPILQPGSTGSWDSDGVIKPEVILHDGEYKMWYSGLSPAVFAIGHATAPIATPEPLIVSLNDIPNDQGKQIRLTWNASLFDGIYRNNTVSEYGIWRRVDETEARQISNNLPNLFNALPTIGQQAIYNGEVWDYIAPITAHQFNQYGFVAPTLGDIMGPDTTFSTFMVTAVGTQTGQIWISDPVTGYSVDNLAPSTPQNLSAQGNDSSIFLNWDGVQDPDFQCFELHRSLTEGFVPNDSTLLISLSATSYTDSIVIPSIYYYYRLAALDFAGNRSEFSNQADSKLTGIFNHSNVLDQFQLYQNYPNPFNPETQISYELPKAADTRLMIYNVLGEHVATLVNEFQSAGLKTVVWDGRDKNGIAASSGIYLYVIQQGTHKLSRKMILMK